MKFLFAVVVFVAGYSIPASAQDATCAKLKNATHKAVCNCHVSNGGWAREEGGGRIRWGARGGSGNMALQNCLAKHQS